MTIPPLELLPIFRFTDWCFVPSPSFTKAMLPVVSTLSSLLETSRTLTYLPSITILLLS
jgi:hypothetical protein